MRDLRYGPPAQIAGTLRPNAYVVGGIDSAADEAGKKRGLAGVIKHGRGEGKIGMKPKFTPLAVPGAWFPARATSVRLPGTLRPDA